MRWPDQADRDRASSATELSLLVEASAGTGKTRTLIDRIATLVLSDREEGGLSLSEIAALTFTEKAAGEMKARLRQRLQEETKGPRGERARHALESLDLAEISTLHAFCARLLRERPVEAGIDPDFITPEKAAVLELYDEVFARWLGEEGRVPGSPVAELLSQGLLPEDLATLGWELHEMRAVLEECTIPTDALSEARERLDELAAGLRELAADAPGWKGTQDILDLALDLELLARADITALAACDGEGSFPLRGAPKDPDWRERAEDLRGRWEKLRDSFRTLPHRILLARAVPRILATLLPALEKAKRERGFFDYDDLLLSARDLLRRSPPARAHFAERFRALLVDEFQDTDPVQAEIVLRLSAPDGGLAPHELEIAGGELFVVGDPKQSIYRFRHADVETYADVKERFPKDARLGLATSFRAHPRLLAWVNRVFKRVLVTRLGRPWEVSYAPLMPGPAEDAPGAPVVYLLPPEELPEGGVGVRRALEARAVAGWLVRQEGLVRWRDVGILVPRNEAIDVMEEALREAGVPSVAEGGKSYARREETGAVLAALRTIADPGDGVALAAALKSFLFGATDLDLVEAGERGFRFDLPGEAPAGCAIAPAVALVQRLRARRHDRPAAETLLALLSERNAVAALEAGAVPRPQQGVRNVERLLASARACDVSGLSFREAVAAMTRTLEEDSPEPRAFEESEDAVRVLTLHKSKGLEFDVVVLAGLGLESRTRGGDDSVRCERPGGRAGVRVAVDGRSVATPRWDEVVAADEERRRAEDCRLLYVGATRARRRLVISWWGDETADDPHAKSLLAPMAFAREMKLFPEGTVEVVTSDPEARFASPHREGEEAEEEAAVDLPRATALAEARLEKARATAARPLRRAGEHAKAVARAEDLPAPDREESDVSDRALRVGIAVHAAMERLLDPARSEPSLEEALAEVSADLPPEARTEVRRLVARLISDDVTARARAAKRRFVEVPLVYRDGEGPAAPLVEGKIDLLFEEEDGLVIVDWKTDRVDSPETLAERRALYAPQLAAYEAGLRAAFGEAARVKESRLVFARACPRPRPDLGGRSAREVPSVETNRRSPPGASGLGRPIGERKVTEVKGASHMLTSARTAPVARLLLPVLAGLAFAALPASASSHNEAPYTSTHPITDDTDFYMFRDPNDPTKVNLIACRYGLIEPQGGPNYARFLDGARYDIKIDNNGDAVEDVTYRFTFKTTYSAPETFLYALPGVTKVDDAKLLVKQTYSLDLVRGPADAPNPANVTRLLTDQPVVPPNIGSKTFPEGYALLRNGLQTAGARTVFVGPRQDPFFVDLGMIFDAVNLNAGPGQGRPGVGVGNMGGGRDTLYGYSVLATGIQVPISELTASGTQVTSASDPGAIVGGWASISIPSTTTVNADGTVSTSGGFQQVSRLGNPLVNEVLIGVGSKDRWNATAPKDEAQFKSSELRPILATYMNVLFGINVPPNTADRPDIQAALFTGIPAALGFLTTRPGEVYSDQVRLNTAIPPTPFASASRMGVLGGDVGGFPNGRRPCDDVVDIELRVVAGVLYGAAGGANGSLYTGSPNNALGDGVDFPERGCRFDFPYMYSPTSGFSALHASEPRPTHAPTARKAVGVGFPQGLPDDAFERFEWLKAAN